MGFDLPLFYLFAAVAVVASILVIGQRSPIYSVMLLIASFVALAGLYVLLDAPFVAVIQIIIYAGAILVLFLFVVMLLNAPKEGGRPWPRLAAGPDALGAALGVVFAVELVWAVWRVASLREPVARGRRAAGRGDRTGAVDRPGALHRLRVRVRGDVAADPRGDGRSGGVGEETCVVGSRQ